MGAALEPDTALQTAEAESQAFTSVFGRSAFAMRDLCLLESENDVYVFPDGEKHFMIFLGPGRRLTDELEAKAGGLFSSLHQPDADDLLLQALDDLARVVPYSAARIDNWVREWRMLMFDYNLHLIIREDLAEIMEKNKQNGLFHNGEGLRLSFRFRVQIVKLQALIQSVHLLLSDENKIAPLDAFEQASEILQSKMQVINILVMSVRKSSHKREERLLQLKNAMKDALTALTQYESRDSFIGEPEGFLDSFSLTITGQEIADWAHFKLRENRLDEDVNICLTSFLSNFTEKLISPRVQEIKTQPSQAAAEALSPKKPSQRQRKKISAFKQTLDEIPEDIRPAGITDDFQPFLDSSGKKRFSLVTYNQAEERLDRIRAANSIAAFASKYRAASRH